MSEKTDKLEDKITSLENIIAELESEGTSLERGIELFEKESRSRGTVLPNSAGAKDA